MTLGTVQDGLVWRWKSVNDSSYQDILSLLTEAIIKSQTTAVFDRAKASGVRELVEL